MDTKILRNFRTTLADRIYKRHVGRYFLSVINTPHGPESSILQDGGDMLWMQAGDFTAQFRGLRNVEQVEKFIFTGK